MRRRAWIGAALVALLAANGAVGGEPPCWEPALACFLRQLAPAGGLFPYGGGLLHWWPEHCFPRCGAPDDYCRKPLPNVCWPPYPPCYIGGAPDSHHPPSSCWPTMKGESHPPSTGKGIVSDSPPPGAKVTSKSE
jgi:hypothetical protein